jgi:hypothetical protein
VTGNSGSGAADTRPLLLPRTSLHALVQQTRSGLGIFLSDTQFDAAEEVGPKPVHPNHVHIDQKTFDSGRIQNALKNKRFRKVSKLA